MKPTLILPDNRYIRADFSVSSLRIHCTHQSNELLDYHHRKLRIAKYRYSLYLVFEEKT